MAALASAPGRLKNALLDLLRIVVALGYIATLSCSMIAMAAYGGALSVFCFITSAGITVINLPILFPWPQKGGGHPTALAKASLLVGFSLSILLFSAGVLGAHPVEEWWAAFVTFGGVSAANLAILGRFPRIDRE